MGRFSQSHLIITRLNSRLLDRTLIPTYYSLLSRDYNINVASTIFLGYIYIHARLSLF